METNNEKKTFEIEIDAIWVNDGFELTAERLKEAILDQLGFALEHEVKVTEVGK